MATVLATKQAGLTRVAVFDDHKDEPCVIANGAVRTIQAALAAPPGQPEFIRQAAT